MDDQHAVREVRPGSGVALPAPRWGVTLARLRADVPLRDASLAALLLLLIVVVSGTVAYGVFGPATSLPGVFRPPGLVDQFSSSLKDTLAAPFARWDSAWYLFAAGHGYAHYTLGPGGGASASFFPLYPFLISVVGALGPGDLIAGVLVSVVSLVVALRMIWLLTRAELGERHRDAPRLAVLATALFPTAFFLVAVYPEALLLALSTGAFWMARQGRWAWAGALGGLAAADHSLGLVVGVPLGLFYLSEHRWRLRWDVLWLALVPAGYVAFMIYLGLVGFDPFWPLYAHEKWQRFFTGPFSGTWDAFRAAWAGVRQIFSGQSVHAYWQPAVAYGRAPITAAADNIEQLAFFLFAAVAAIAALRRLPLAYGGYVAAALILIVSYPIAAEPLSGLSRYVAVLFPVQIIMGRWLADHRRWRIPLLSLSALALVFYSAYFATWHWVA